MPRATPPCTSPPNPAPPTRSPPPSSPRTSPPPPPPPPANPTGEPAPHVAAFNGHPDQVPRAPLPAETLLPKPANPATCLPAAAIAGPLDQIPAEVLTHDNLVLPSKS